MNPRILFAIPLFLPIAILGQPAIAANPDHVQRLLKTNQCPLCDLSGASLKEANLYGANLVGANLKGADLTGANLGSANLSDADLSGAKLNQVYLYQAIVEETRLNGADLSGAYLKDASIVKSSFVGANFSGANLSRLNLSGNDLRQANFNGANLSGASLTGVRLVGVSGRQAGELAMMQFSRYLCQDTFDYESIEQAREAGIELFFANLSGVNLQGANLSDANLAAANLVGANLQNANLRGACLRGSKLNNAILDGADLQAAVLKDAVIEGASFKGVNNAALKDAVLKPGPVDNQITRAKQAEARNYVGAMNRSQQAYYLEQEKFARTLNDLAIGIKSETTNYLYRVFVRGSGKQQRAISAGIAKADGLKSYIGFVSLSVVPSTKELTTSATMCESEAPTKLLPSGEVLDRLTLQSPCPPGYKVYIPQ